MIRCRRYFFYILIAISLLSEIAISQSKFIEFSKQMSSASSVDILAGFRRSYFEGYTQTPSINKGAIIQFKISTLAAYTPYSHIITTVPCLIKIYRVTSTSLSQDVVMSPAYSISATFYPLHDRFNQLIYPEDSTSNYNNSKFPIEYKVGCNWATSFSYTIPTNFPSGFYYAKIYLPGQESDLTKTGYIPFVVKASSPGTESNMLCVIAWNTYQAYNYWGGGSLYWWTGAYDTNYDGTAIETVSFRRPMGWHHHDGIVASTQFGHLDFRERAFIAWAENNGYHLGYCVDADINDGTIINNQTFKAVFIPGHSEYWSRPERTKIELNTSAGFKGQGGHLAFYAANNCYWRVDYKTGTSNNPDSMTCSKVSLTSAPWGENMWRYQSEGPEAKFIGVQFEMVNNSNIPNLVQKASHWTFRGTALNNGNQFGLGGNGYDPVAAGESDMYRSNISPSNTVVLGEVYMGTITPPTPHSDEVSNVYSDVTYYEDVNTNSRVFAAGGMGWSGCLFGTDAPIMRKITSNVQDHFNGKKFIGNIYSGTNPRLIWANNIQLDGYVTILAGKYLVVDGTATPITVQIDSMLTVYGNFEIKGNVTFSGSGNIIVQNNGTLLVDPGATITLTNGKSIIINNSTITALASSTSPITFDFVQQNTSSPFNGIMINSGSTGNFSYSTIKNAYYGLSAYSAVVAMSNCEIYNCYDAVYLNYISNSSIFSLNKFHDNTDSGFRLFSNSSPYITQNQFYKNFNGVLCQDNSSPSFRDNSSSYTGKNDIYQNTMGFTCSAATPWLGSPTLPTFNNMIENNNPNNTGYDVRLYNGCTVQASKVWWGSPGTNPPTSPYIKIYYGTGGGTLVMLSPLQSRPTSMLPKALALNNGGSSAPPQSDGSISTVSSGSLYNQLFQAEDYFFQKNYSAAEDKCKYLIETYPDSSASIPAVDLLCKVANESNDNTLKPYLEKFQAKGTKNLYGKIERILAGYERANRIQRLDNIIKKYNNYPVQVQYAMLEQVVYYLYEQNDFSKAISVYQKMSNLYPDEFPTLQVRDVLGLSPKANQNLFLINKDFASNNNKPNKYELTANYPNPFNPNTKIKFSLPEDNLTILKVFDALGREVATLVNEVRPAGNYEVTFNAENLPSGLYIYQIKSGKFIESRKMLLMK